MFCEQYLIYTEYMVSGNKVGRYGQKRNLEEALEAVAVKLSEYGIAYNRQMNDGLTNVSFPLTRRERRALKRKKK